MTRPLVARVNKSRPIGNPKNRATAPGRIGRLIQSSRAPGGVHAGPADAIRAMIGPDGPPPRGLMGRKSMVNKARGTGRPAAMKRSAAAPLHVVEFFRASSAQFPSEAARINFPARIRVTPEAL